MQFAGLISGGLLIAFGRRLFWLFVGLVGFFVGYRIAEQLFPNASAMAVFAGLFVGVISAILAVFFQRLAILIGGFLAGGYLAVALLGVLTGETSTSWLPFVLGGILGAILLNVIFDWALIILSSLFGAVLVTRYAGVEAPLGTALIVGLFILGLVLQGGVIKWGR